MRTIGQLEKIIEDNAIIYVTGYLTNNVLGHYSNNDVGEMILMNDKLQHRSTLGKCILAEEVGHYYTALGKNEPNKENTYEKKVKIEKEEEKAARWSAQYLIETDLLLEYLSENIYATFEDLCDHFDVLDNVMIQKLRVMSHEDLYWKVRESYYLCLAKLPTVFITKLFNPKNTLEEDDLFY